MAPKARAAPLLPGAPTEPLGSERRPLEPAERAARKRRRLCSPPSDAAGAFLFESDQEALRFLNGFQLRVLFTILTGALASTASLCADLNDPFRGSFRITANAEQLAMLRATMEGAMCA